MSTSMETVQDFIVAFVRGVTTEDPPRWDHSSMRKPSITTVPWNLSSDAQPSRRPSRFMSMGGSVDVDIIHIASEGPTVMTERIDHFTREGGTRISLPDDGSDRGPQWAHCCAWRDYFDLSQFTSQCSGQADRARRHWAPK